MCQPPGEIPGDDLGFLLVDPYVRHDRAEAVNSGPPSEAERGRLTILTLLTHIHIIAELRPERNLAGVFSFSRVGAVRNGPGRKGYFPSVEAALMLATPILISPGRTSGCGR